MVDKLTHELNELERSITRMKSNIANTSQNLFKIDLEIEEERKEIVAYEEAA